MRKAMVVPGVAGVLALWPEAAAWAAECVENVPEGADLAGYLLSLLPDSWGGAVTLLVSVCAAVAAFWRRPADDANVVIRVLYAVVNAVGFNKGRATNADDAAASAAKAGK